MSSPSSTSSHVHLLGQPTNHHVAEESQDGSRLVLRAEEQALSSTCGGDDHSRYNGNTENSRSSTSTDGEAETLYGSLLRGSSLSTHNCPLRADRRLSFVEEEETRTDDNDEHPGTKDDKDKPVSWMSLPKKDQLVILTLARLSEPLAQTSLQSYLFYQLKSFDPSLPDSAISRQAGILQGIFTAAQFLTAILWGRLADTDWMGRKQVLLIGLFGTALQSLGFGFSRSFASAAVFRTLGGVLNGNVGVMRTMIAEIIEEKK